MLMLCLCRSANASEILHKHKRKVVTLIRHLDCSCGKLVSRYFVNTAPAYALMLMFWCSHLLLNFAYACAYAQVKNQP